VSTETFWVLIGLCALVTAIIKATGPIALGGRELPPRFGAVIRLMAPALLSALVCVAVFAQEKDLGVSEDTAGVAVAGIALLRGANIVIGVVIAAGVTALLRAV
jgi:branched-subunit amino acid transport protein